MEMWNVENSNKVEKQTRGNLLNVKKNAKVFGIIIIIPTLLSFVSDLLWLPMVLAIAKGIPWLLSIIIFSLIMKLLILVSVIGLIKMKKRWLYLFIVMIILQILSLIYSLITTGSDFNGVLIIINAAFAGLFWRGRDEFH